MKAECLVCGSLLSPWFVAAGRSVERCRSCGHIQVPAGLARVEGGLSIYEADDPIFTADGNAEYYLDETNMMAGRAKLAFVRKFVSGGTLLDVGASYGHFLVAANERFQAEGFELSPAAVEFSVSNFRVANVRGSIYEWPMERDRLYNVITCWDVIEHVEDPIESLRIMSRHLVPGGWLFLSTPDAGALVARMMGKRWHYLDPVQHLHVFSKRNLTRILAKTGFAVRGSRSFGRSYKVRYVVSRLGYLYQASALRPIVSALTRASRPVDQARIPIKLGDVMGLAAQRT